MGTDFVSYLTAMDLGRSPFTLTLQLSQLNFLGNLVKIFPGLATRPLLLTGESYAGTYIVILLSFLHVNCLITLRITAIYREDHIFRPRAACEAGKDCHWKRCDGLLDRNRYHPHRTFSISVFAFVHFMTNHL